MGLQEHRKTKRCAGKIEMKKGNHFIKMTTLTSISRDDKIRTCDP